MKRLYLLLFTFISGLLPVEHPLYYFRVGESYTIGHPDGSTSEEYQWVGVEAALLKKETHPEGSLLATLRAAFLEKKAASESSSAPASASASALAREGDAQSYYISLGSDISLDKFVHGIDSEDVVWFQSGYLLIAFYTPTIVKSTLLADRIVSTGGHFLPMEIPATARVAEKRILSFIHICFVYSLLYLSEDLAESKGANKIPLPRRYFDRFISTWGEFSGLPKESFMFTPSDDVRSFMDFLRTFKPPNIDVSADISHLISVDPRTLGSIRTFIQATRLGERLAYVSTRYGVKGAVSTAVKQTELSEAVTRGSLSKDAASLMLAEKRFSPGELSRRAEAATAIQSVAKEFINKQREKQRLEAARRAELEEAARRAAVEAAARKKAEEAKKKPLSEWGIDTSALPKDTQLSSLFARRIAEVLKLKDDGLPAGITIGEVLEAPARMNEEDARSIVSILEEIPPASGCVVM